MLGQTAGFMKGGPWSVEKRFRVTEVFLAVLWVSLVLYLQSWAGALWDAQEGIKEPTSDELHGECLTNSESTEMPYGFRTGRLCWRIVPRLIPTVLCISLPLVLLHGLPHVTLVRFLEPLTQSTPTNNTQAFILYPTRYFSSVPQEKQTLIS
jgi:hypothetical protein